MPQIHLDDETVARLDALHEDDEEYDDLINELMNIYEASERTLLHTDGEYWTRLDIDARAFSRLICGGSLYPEPPRGRSREEHHPAGGVPHYSR